MAVDPEATVTIRIVDLVALVDDASTRAEVRGAPPGFEDVRARTMLRRVCNELAGLAGDVAKRNERGVHLAREHVATMLASLADD